MKTLVLYTSQTGFTKNYAYWINEQVGGQVLRLKDVTKMPSSFFDDFDTIIYGGWTMGGKIVKAEWFLEKAASWKNKKLVIYCCGATPNDNPDIQPFLDRILTDEQKQYIKAFYCQAGINYKKMKFASKLAMKAFVTMLRNKVDKNQQEIDMMNLLSESFDNSDKKYIQPIVDYILGK